MTSKACLPSFGVYLEWYEYEWCSSVILVGSKLVFWAVELIYQYNEPADNIYLAEHKDYNV